MSTPSTPGKEPGGAAIDAFRNPDGDFTMVAIDQRSSLRHMYAAAQQVPTITDDQLADFKADVADALTGDASGILLDRQFGERAAAASRSPVILAADILTASLPGGPIDLSEIDEGVGPEIVERMRASALKLLVPWLPETRAAALDLTQEFIARCDRLGLPSVVEGVIRPRDPASWTSERLSEALIQAAEDLCAVEPALYKTEVVYGGDHDVEIAVETARAITEVIGCPWVILSSGVSVDDFPAAVAAACRGGAQGFLAGRAIWAGALAARQPADHLRTESSDRLRRLAMIARENRA
jgi:sulfofructosephosphate aldolase